MVALWNIIETIRHLNDIGIMIRIIIKYIFINLSVLRSNKNLY